jgi:branched-chain amino acid transport system ATP-binding protein
MTWAAPANEVKGPITYCWRSPYIFPINEGLAPILVNRIIPRLRDVASTGIAVVLVEQFARLALQVGDRGYVLAKGGIEYEGSCRELMADEQLLNAAYFRRVEPA